MRHTLLCTLVLLSLCLALASSTDCMSVVEQHLRIRTKKAVPYHPDNMVFFLHVPRTAGRTFHVCLLKPGTPDERRCARAYDHLRINADVPSCHLLSSHDDFSVVEMLSKEHLTVVTQMRDPVDRLLSAYEFAIELAARALTRKKPVKKAEGRVVTEDVWPWSYFIPWFKNNIQQRVAELNNTQPPEGGSWVERAAVDGRIYHFNKHLNATRWPEKGVKYPDVLPLLDPYNNPLVMPLEEFIRHPIAKELLHEGGMLQVLGVTNYSHYQEAAAVRECLFSDGDAHKQLLQVALERLDTFAHVGLMDRLDDSVRSAAASLQMALDEKAFVAKPPLWGRWKRQLLAEQEGHNQEAEAWDGAAGEEGAGRHDEADDEDAEEYAGGEWPVGVEGTAAVGAEGQGGELQNGTGGGGEAGEAAAEWGQDQRHAAAEELAQATQRMRDAHHDLLHALENEASSRQVHRLRKQLDEAKEALREAQDSLLEDREDHVREARKMQQHRDDHGRLRTRDPLGTVFRRCMGRSQQRNKRRKQVSLAQLQMPDGRSIVFAKEARAALPEHIIKAVRDLNPGDTALYEKAKSLLHSRMEQHLQQGVLGDLPARKPRKLQRRRQRLQEHKEPQEHKELHDSRPRDGHDEL